MSNTVAEASRAHMESWRRTEFAVVAAVFLYFAGTSFVIPFIPLYIAELDDFDLAGTALWSGPILAASPLVSGIVAPFWGRLSDRYGQKILLQRSLAGFTICLGLMAVADSAGHLLVIRIFMGLVGGFTVTSQTMLSLTVPTEKVAGAIGRLNAGRVLGMAIGPIPGGILADTIGVRAACLASVIGGVLAFVIVTVLAKPPVEVRPPQPSAAQRPRSQRPRVMNRRFFGLLVSGTSVRLVEKSFDPILPLLIATFVANPFGIGTTTALVSASGLFATALGATVTSGVGGSDPEAHTWRLRALLLFAGLCTAAAFFCSSWWLLLVIRVLVGLALGVAGALTITQAALGTPRERRGASMGILGSGTAIGSAAGALGAGLLAPLALAAVFLADGVLLVVSSVLLVRKPPRSPD